MPSDETMIDCSKTTPHNGQCVLVEFDNYGETIRKECYFKVMPKWFCDKFVDEDEAEVVVCNYTEREIKWSPINAIR